MTYTSNKQIAKNTLYLIIRIVLITFVSFFTSRIYLNQLGIVDFGLYNLVGGIIAIVGVIQGVLASAVSRFFIIEIGRNDMTKLNEYFRLSILVYLFLGFLIIVLAESIGLWFLLNKLIIPKDRINAVLWVYQFSILSFFFSMLTVPYSSMILAKEKLDLFVFLGIIEALMKLIIAFLLSIMYMDKLILFAGLNLLTILILFFCNFYYCKIKFQTVSFKWYWDIIKLKEMFNYSIWTLFGAVSSVTRNQGLNILLGIFFVPTINASRAIASQINDGIVLFSNNFQMAVRPKITKIYISGDLSLLKNTIYNSSKISFFLLYILSLPFLLETEYILKFWLGSPPNESISFTRIVIITSLVDSLSYPLISAINATGKIKFYQIITGGILVLTMPLAYIFLKLGFKAESVLYVSFFISCLAQFSRLFFMKKYLNLSIKTYITEVLFVLAIVAFSSLIVPYFIYSNMLFGTNRFIIILSVIIIFTPLFIFTFGLNKGEKNLILNYLKKILIKFK